MKADLQLRPYDLPWFVLDSGRAQRFGRWRPKRSVESVREEIAEFAERHPEWPPG